MTEEAGRARGRRGDEEVEKGGEEGERGEEDEEQVRSERTGSGRKKLVRLMTEEAGRAGGKARGSGKKLVRLMTEEAGRAAERREGGGWEKEEEEEDEEEEEQVRSEVGRSGRKKLVRLMTEEAGRGSGKKLVRLMTEEVGQAEGKGAGGGRKLVRLMTEENGALGGVDEDEEWDDEEMVTLWEGEDESEEEEEDEEEEESGEEDEEGGRMGGPGGLSLKLRRSMTVDDDDNPLGPCPYNEYDMRVGTGGSKAAKGDGVGAGDGGGRGAMERKASLKLARSISEDSGWLVASLRTLVVCCGVVWCGVVWCGVVWCGVVWCGVVWYGVVWGGVVWCGCESSLHAARPCCSTRCPTCRPSEPPSPSPYRPHQDHHNDALVCACHTSQVPPCGQAMLFHPLPHLPCCRSAYPAASSTSTSAASPLMPSSTHRQPAAHARPLLPFLPILLPLPPVSLQDHHNDALQIVCAYHTSQVPPCGQAMLFHPLPHLLPLGFSRSELDIDERCFPPHADDLLLRELMHAEEAAGVACFAVAAACRALSLDNILTVLAAVLLERQIVFVCPNLSVLSAVVLSLIPMIRPFSWQSVLLPILPSQLLTFLDAPVPFLVGMQYKTVELKDRASNLIQVNIPKDKVKVPTYLPRLPDEVDLYSRLEPFHSALASMPHADKRPMYRTTEDQVAAADGFLMTLRSYVDTFCTDVRIHTITSVNQGGQRVSLLLKESFVNGFPEDDQEFFQVFAGTQLFTMHIDTLLASDEVM
ncbi:unnamed protein product [Closterium sp. NIES-53]